MTDTQRFNSHRRLRVILALLLAVLMPLQALAMPAFARFGKGDKAIEWPVNYLDSFFSEPGTSYKQELATASLAMALSAFRKTDVPLAESNKNIRAFFQETGFDKAAYTQYDVPPTINTIGTAMAQKQIDGVTVVAVAVSGGGYKDEWKSNFSIGDSEHHIGFDSAARQVLQRLRVYLSAHGLTGKPVKLWISGYSRAAATSNRLGALILDEKIVPAQDLYDYTFATPNVTKQKNATSYQSIYNVVGAFDPVPMVPFADWGFGRYGKSFVLPAPQINSDYNKRVAPVSAMHLLYTGTPYWTNPSGISAVGKVLASLGETVRDTKEYTDNVQPLMMDLWNQRTKPLSMLATVAQHVALKKDGLGSVVGKLFTIASNSLGDSLLQDAGLFKKQWKEDKSLQENLAREHYPEGYMAWMAAYPTLEGMISPSVAYRQIEMEGFDKIGVQDERGQLVQYFRIAPDGSMQQRMDSSLWLSQQGDALTLTVPADRNHTVLVYPAKNGPVMTVRVKEGTAGHTRTQLYDAGPIKSAPAEGFNLSLPAVTTFDKPADGAYQLTNASGKLPLKYIKDATAISARDSHSSFASTFSQNVVTVVVVIVLVIAFVLFMMLLISRAARRGHTKRRLKKEGRPLKDVPFRGHFLNRALPNQVPIKITALSVLGTGMAMAVAVARVYLVLLGQMDVAPQGTIRVYTLFYFVPFLILVTFCALPAIFAGVTAILWRQDKYVLRTSRLNARMALFFSLCLGLVLTQPSYSFFSLILLVAAPLQIILLFVLLKLQHRVLKKDRHPHRLPKGEDGTALPEGEGDRLAAQAVAPETEPETKGEDRPKD